MPEGDTIAKLAARIGAAVGNEPVLATVSRDPRLVGQSFDGARLVEVEAVGKFLLLRFDSAVTLYSHLQMDGEWHVGKRPPVPAWRRRLELEFPSAVLTAVDMPEIGVVPTIAESDVVGYLGPNLCGPQPPTADEMVHRLQASPELPLAAALLDQRRLAGFGNVFAVELPFLAGVAPFAPTDEITDLDGLAAAGRALIRWSAAGHPRNTTGRRMNRADHYLYGLATTGAHTALRDGFVLTDSRCTVCGDRIGFADSADTEWGRSSWWCPTCQPAPGSAVDGRRLRRLLALHPAMRAGPP